MGRPLRKLHQTHSVFPHGCEICNIRTTGSRIHPFPKRMQQRFVSKNHRLEKAHRKTAGDRWIVPVI
jgi:hypothetical protein